MLNTMPMFLVFLISLPDSVHGMNGKWRRHKAFLNQHLQQITTIYVKAHKSIECSAERR